MGTFHWKTVKGTKVTKSPSNYNTQFFRVQDKKKLSNSAFKQIAFIIFYGLWCEEKILVRESFFGFSFCDVFFLLFSNVWSLEAGYKWLPLVSKNMSPLVFARNEACAFFCKLSQGSQGPPRKMRGEITRIKKQARKVYFSEGVSDLYVRNGS